MSLSKNHGKLPLMGDNISRKNLNSRLSRLKDVKHKKLKKKRKKQKLKEADEGSSSDSGVYDLANDKKKCNDMVNSKNQEIPVTIDETKYYSLDCEFVGVDPNNKSALGRCSIVDFNGNIILDIYSQPESPIVDYRTRWSGLTKYHMKKAVPFENARSIIRKTIAGKIIVGHSVDNDFTVLQIFHPRELIRDTAKIPELRKMIGQTSKQGISLRNLSNQLLDRSIQTGSHCSVEDARATMDIFKLVIKEVEQGKANVKKSSSTKRKISCDHGNISKKTKLGVNDRVEKKLSRTKSAPALSSLDEIVTSSTCLHKSESSSDLTTSFFDDNYWPDDL